MGKFSQFLWIIIGDGFTEWIIFVSIRFKESLISFICFPIFYLFFTVYFFKYWQISVELFHVPSLSRKDLTGIQW